MVVGVTVRVKVGARVGRSIGRCARRCMAICRQWSRWSLPDRWRNMTSCGPNPVVWIKVTASTFPVVSSWTLEGRRGSGGYRCRSRWRLRNGGGVGRRCKRQERRHQYYSGRAGNDPWDETTFHGNPLSSAPQSGTLMERFQTARQFETSSDGTSAKGRSFEPVRSHGAHLWSDRLSRRGAACVLGWPRGQPVRTASLTPLIVTKSDGRRCRDQLRRRISVAGRIRTPPRSGPPPVVASSATGGARRRWSGRRS